MIPKRYNTDTLVDDYGKRLLHVCKSTDMITANGRTGNSKCIRSQTFFGQNGSSTVDYLLIGLLGIFTLHK